MREYVPKVGFDVRPRRQAFQSYPPQQTSQNAKVARESPVQHVHRESRHDLCEATVLAGAAVTFPVSADEALAHASLQCSVPSITVQGRGRLC